MHILFLFFILIFSRHSNILLFVELITFIGLIAFNISFLYSSLISYISFPLKNAVVVSNVTYSV